MKNYKLIMLLLFLMASCSTNTENVQSEENKNIADSTTSLISKPYIDPPFKNVDVREEKFSFNAEEGDTLFSEHGSIILFPANSLVDKAGKLIKGKVEVSYKEYRDPVDFFVSGIPMDYQMNGENYIFESSGMMQMNVKSNNIPVFVNPENKPEVNLTTSNTDPEHNLYFLDTIQKRWIEKGKHIITDANKKKPGSAENKTTAATQSLVKPEKPIKASGTQPAFEIEMDPSALPELQTYHNLKFEVDKSEKSYNPKDGDVEWEDVKVEKTEKSGLYKVTFSKKNKKVSYITRPVFEGKDYEAALKIFESKNKEYERLVNTRLNKEKLQNEKIKNYENQEKLQVEKNARIRKLNILIDARNEKMAARNKLVIGGNAEMAIFRSFSIDGFGYFNCDRPIPPGTIYVISQFMDENGKGLNLQKITVAYKNIKAVKICNSTLTLIANGENLLMSVIDSKFVYLTYQDFASYAIAANSKTASFKMRTYPGEITSPNQIRELLGISNYN